MGADRYSTANTCTSLESACRNLCEQVIATLPRELRDIIYEHILSQEVWDVAALPTSEPTSAKTGPHYWQVEKVGNATLNEILEVWYRLVRFHIGQDLGYLKRFLTSKAASLDTSRQLLVTNISIAFDSRDVETHMQPTGGGVVRDSSSRTRMLERLEHLFLLKEGASIHIYVIVPHSYTLLAEAPTRYAHHERKVLREATTAISNVLIRLATTGYSLSTAIMLASRWPNNGSLYDMVSERSKRDARSCFVTGNGSNLMWL
jgi:hypothetical protein